MRKIAHIVLSTMLIASIMTPVKTATAGDIDKTKARQVAAYFMASQFGDKSITAQNIEQIYELRNTVRDIPALYIFNTADKRGYVIVSGSDCADPIIAYSTDGSLDPNNIPPNMMWWLNEQADAIAYAQNNGIEPSAHNLEAWDELESERLPYFGQDQKGITILMTSKWNQEPLYNSWCPYDAGGQCVTGCVATAMAQIIYFWKYPRVGKSMKSYAWNGTAIELNFEDQYYHYELMADELTQSSDSVTIAEVAKLSYHCGVAVEMGYGSESSGAQSDKVPTAFRKHFKYVRDSMEMISRTDEEYFNANNATSPNAKDTLWVEKIKEQILKGRPVYYAGYAPNSGVHARHAFVCDGWNSVGFKLHFNWGWGGYGDGWCNVYRSYLNAPGYQFTNEHKVVLGITPPADSLNQHIAVPVVDDPFVGGIYPNPASNHIIVSHHIDGNSAVDMVIFDATGREVRRIAVAPSSYQTTVDVSNLRPGIYICRLQGYSKKFIVK